MNEIDLDTLVLTTGAHRSREEGVCAMEAAAWLAGEAHSDVPACVCFVLCAYVQRLNDAEWSSDAARTAALRPWIPRLLHTATGDAAGIARASWLADRALSTWAPLALQAGVLEMEALGFDATRLRTLGRALVETPNRETVFAALQETERDRTDISVCNALAATFEALEYREAMEQGAAYASTDVVTSVGEVVMVTSRAVLNRGFVAGDPSPDPFLRDLVLRAAVEDLGALLALGAGGV